MQFCTTIPCLYFDIFIGDVVNDFIVKCLLYADDLKLNNKKNSVSDCLTLQSSLKTVRRWCQHNNLVMNIERCNVVSFELKSELSQYGFIQLPLLL